MAFDDGETADEQEEKLLNLRERISMDNEARTVRVESRICGSGRKNQPRMCFRGSAGSEVTSGEENS